MLETNRGRALLVGVGIVVAVLAVIEVKRYRDTMEIPWALFTPNQQVAVVNRMAELRDKGLFGDAINLGLHSTNGHSDDYFIYQMIAATYFIRALHDKDQSGKWTKLGAEYSQKALDSNPKEIANVFNVGVNYRIAGDDLDTGVANTTGKRRLCLRASSHCYKVIVPKRKEEHSGLQLSESETRRNYPG